MKERPLRPANYFVFGSQIIYQTFLVLAFFFLQKPSVGSYAPGQKFREMVNNGMLECRDHLTGLQSQVVEVCQVKLYTNSHCINIDPYNMEHTRSFLVLGLKCRVENDSKNAIDE